MVLDMQPGEHQAMSFLAEAFSASEQWDALAALYEDQLKGGGVKAGEELGMCVQIAMVHWRMRSQPQAAEPFFERVRKGDPSHAGMLNFFREHLTAKGDKSRLAAILTDAQRAMADGPDKVALSTEIAKLAESAENAQKAIEQYKAVLRTDPENKDARDALKRQFAGSVLWQQTIEGMFAAGVRHFVECGPKPTLVNMVKRIALAKGIEGVETFAATTADEVAALATKG